jgi:hypothetical protein
MYPPCPVAEQRKFDYSQGQKISPGCHFQISSVVLAVYIACPFSRVAAFYDTRLQLLLEELTFTHVFLYCLLMVEVSDWA